jgi:hypothetical protein
MEVLKADWMREIEVVNRDAAVPAHLPPSDTSSSADADEADAVSYVHEHDFERPIVSPYPPYSSEGEAYGHGLYGDGAQYSEWQPAQGWSC